MRFAELGAPFPLYEADASTASDYQGVGACTICGALDQHVFSLEEGGALVAMCAGCGLEHEVNIAFAHESDDEEPPRCRRCDAPIAVPEAPVLACYACVRAGRAIFPKHTSEGSIDLDAIRSGHAGPAQGRTSEHFAVVEVDLRTNEARPASATPYPAHERKVRHFAACVPLEHVTELLRTPDPIGQGAWPFCCARPAVYLGTWQPDDPRPDDLADALDEIFAQHPKVFVDVWRCGSCRSLRWSLER